MKIILVRHGEPDYDNSLATAHTNGRIHKDAVCLAKGAVTECENISKIIAKYNPDIVITSPYSRALHTAHILSYNLSVPLFVENDLREWDTEISIQEHGKKMYDTLLEEITLCNGVHSPSCTFQWESIDGMVKRFYNVLEKYIKYDTVIIVSHKMLIYQISKLDLPFCGFCVIDKKLQNR